MPFSDAFITTVVSVHPDKTVKEALSILQQHNLRKLPVVDDSQRLVGMFGTSTILKKLLPVAATMEDGLQRLDFVLGTAPGSAKRLRKIMPDPVSTVMDDKVAVAYPNTPAWEGIRLLVKYGSPLPVVEPKTGKLVGIVSDQSTIKTLEQLLIEIEREEARD